MIAQCRNIVIVKRERMGRMFEEGVKCMAPLEVPASEFHEMLEIKCKECGGVTVVHDFGRLDGIGGMKKKDFNQFLKANR